jgi:uncharacterized membrane protein
VPVKCRCGTSLPADPTGRVEDAADDPDRTSPIAVKAYERESHMSKLRIAAAVATAAGLALVLSPAPAHADVAQASCDRGFGLYTSGASAEYTTSGATQHWSAAEYSFSSSLGFPVGNKSNVNFRLRKSPDGTHSTSHKTYFSYDSPDALHPNTTYTTQINKDVPASESIYVKFDTIFDLPDGVPDINCEAYTPFV